MDSTTKALDHRQLYRLPWSLPDNPIAWMEPTSACNFTCNGCYRLNVHDSHKPLKEVEEEVQGFLSLRNVDSISIAGGDPLTHPDIIDIVKIIASYDLKPIINTNGDLLTKGMLRDLKRAGAIGFTFHVDSTQNRPGVTADSEVALNDVRYEFAEMLAAEGGLTCGFNSTVHEGTLHETPDLLTWAAQNIDIVHLMVFILFRTVTPRQSFDYYIGSKLIDTHLMPYKTTIPCDRELSSRDVVAEIRKDQPEFSPCAYLNGSEDPGSLKWLLSGRIGTRRKIYGYVGPRFMELAQGFNHLKKGRYLAYSHPRVNERARSMFLLSPLDPGLRGTAAAYLRDSLTNPGRLFGRLRYQSVMIIQPVDILEDGRQNMCDSCPDMTLWNGRLVWSCRMEELNVFGSWVQCVPRKEN
jgi:hypothetical protein